MTSLEKLFEDLRKAVEVFADNERLGVGQSLAAVNDYLDDIGVPGDLSMPLLALLMALHDLENGKQPDMLKKAKLSHAPPLANVVQTTRAQAAAAMQVFMDAGYSKQSAARVVARALQKKGVDANWQKVARWRDELNEKPKDDLAVMLFHALANEHKALNLRPTDVAKALLDDFGWTAKENPKIPPS